MARSVVNPRRDKYASSTLGPSHAAMIRVSVWRAPERLSAAAQWTNLWGQARAHVEQLMTQAPSPLVLELRAEVAEATGDDAAAAAHRRAGLALAIGFGPHAALPPPAS